MTLPNPIVINFRILLDGKYVTIACGHVIDDGKYQFSRLTEYDHLKILTKKTSSISIKNSKSLKTKINYSQLSNAQVWISAIQNILFQKYFSTSSFIYLLSSKYKYWPIKISETKKFA